MQTLDYPTQLLARRNPRGTQQPHIGLRTPAARKSAAVSAVALPTKFKISRRSGGFAHAQHTGVSGTFRCGRENSILLVGLGKPNAAMHQHGRGERRIACAIGFCKRVSYTSEPRLGPHLALVIWRRESAVCNPVRSARLSDQSGEVCCIDKIPTAAGANLYCVSNS